MLEIKCKKISNMSRHSVLEINLYLTDCRLRRVAFKLTLDSADAVNARLTVDLMVCV